MAVDDAFTSHCLELLQLAGPVRVRRLFGGRGFYSGDVMFALISDDTLYLRVDDETRAGFVAAGGEPFVYDGGRDRRPVVTAYYTVPLAAMDEPELMTPWALQAIAAARRAQAAKKPKRARKARPAGA